MRTPHPVWNGGMDVLFYPMKANHAKPAQKKPARFVSGPVEFLKMLETVHFLQL